MTALAQMYRKHIEQITERTLAAVESNGFDGVFIHSGRLVQKSPFDDIDWPFLPVPAFSHWADLRWPDCAILAGHGRAQLAIVRPNSYWEAPPAADWDHLSAGLETVEVESADQLGDVVGAGRWAFIGHEAAVAQSLGFDTAAINPADLVQDLHEARVHKTDYEIECLAEANRIGARGHRTVAQAFARGVRSELALHLSFLAATGQDDPEAPYKNIVALGRHAAVLHHISYRDVPKARSLLIDAGAVHRRYNADITRTMVDDREDADGDLFRDLIQRMNHLQQEVCASIRVGENYEALHETMHQLLGDVLVEVGLVRCSAEGASAQGITRVFLPHGLGHGLGVQVHDVGHKNRPPSRENRFLRNTRDIEPRQVFTIEPGVYFIDSLLEALRDETVGDDIDWDTVERLKPFGGIRIEDNVVVTEDEDTPIRNLTREAFAALPAA